MAKKTQMGVRWKRDRIGLARLMLTAMVVVAGCGGSSHHPIILPTATPTTAAATPTPTPVKTTTPTGTPAMTTTSTPTVVGSITPTATPTAVGPTALWVENSLNETVSEFSGKTLTSPGVSVPTPTVQNKSANNIPDTSGVSFDGSKNQWVSVCGKTGTPNPTGTINEFTATTLSNLSTNPAPAADLTLTDDGTGKLVNCPWATTFNGSNMWVANSNQNTAPPGFVTEYQPAQLVKGGQPFAALTDTKEFVSPTGVVFDSMGDLFVSDFGPVQFGTTASGKIWVFTAASLAPLAAGGTHDIPSTVSLTDPTLMTPVNGAFDPKTGNLWVADCEENTKLTGEIYMFPKAKLITGEIAASAIFQSTSIATPNGNEDTLNCPGGVAFDAAGNLWYTNDLSLHVDGAVGEFTAAQIAAATGTTTPTPNIFLEGDTTGTNLNGPIGLTFGPVF